jgi:Tfp pilus assembly protein PilN
MQEINLLQTKVKDRTLAFEKSNRIAVALFSLLVVLEILGVVGLVFVSNRVDKEKANVLAENLKIQANMNSSQSTLDAARGFQAQLKNVRTLLNNHVYWSAFFQNLSSVTPTNVKYTSFTGSLSDGQVVIDGVAPTYPDIGKVILSLSTSKNYSNVKLTALNPSQTNEFGYSFSIKLSAASDSFRKLP